ncbi:hypothetical protein PLESTB_001608700 [Pleodorina starrii]|uniref:Uncharacterized protein n=1 Tax=Pleodorina starrii TaxID=330485 RepID=A0A9W6F964_9CHLO|nr:hypothetical protein PLESTB_001608700 [Pleodorina starrii]GLC64133.1 hypothetical protein PLESTF_000128000 [Pleodorina starrii]
MHHLQPHRARFTQGSTGAWPHRVHAHASCGAAPVGRRAHTAPALGLLPPPGLPSVYGAPSGAACLAAAPQQGAATTAPSPLVTPYGWADGDVLRLVLADGRTVYAEVLASRPAARTNPPPRQTPRIAAGTGGGASTQSVQLLCQGGRYTVRPHSTASDVVAAATTAAAGAGGDLLPAEQVADGPALVLEAAGGALPPGDPLRAMLESPPKRHAAALRAWGPLTARLMRPPTQPPQRPAAMPPQEQQQQQQQQPQPGEPGSLDGALVVSFHRTAWLGELRRQAAVEPGTWCVGSGPSDPPASDDARALFTAGELACLLEGRRGVVLLQLHVGWDAHDRVPPYGPYKPLSLRLLREALERPDIVSYCSSAPVPGAAGAAAAAGNPAYGLTMVLCADKEPYRSWGAHVASFGCQAALEAQSPYYKLLIGRILGYRPDNIAHYIQEKHGRAPSGEVVAAVEQQLLRLSSKRPTLPWNASSRGGGGGGRKKAK